MMGLLPRRKSFLLKFLLLVPAVWFVAVLFFAYGNNGGGYQSGNENGEKGSEVVGKRDDQVGKAKDVAPPKVADKAADVAAEKAKKDESDTPKSEDAVMGEPNIPKPKKFAIDPDSAIYKHEKNQAGESGKPVSINKNDLKPEEKKQYDDGWTNNAFNQYVSDMISIHRTLPATADKECVENKYNNDLPDTSVIVCFHNEAWSVLLRTVHSVIERTPDKLLKEIILVDDCSDKPHLKEPLEEYMSQYRKVKIVRLEKREGLIRARLRGFDASKGKVVTFLDSHCECTDGWLEPLLDRIKTDPKIVVCPVIDVIDDTTFEYHYSKAYFTNVGGFDWSLQFNWHPIPERDRKSRKRAVDPVASPTMAGGLFAIDREFFDHLGTYDSGFDIWGGENLELSFKIWMCGGRLEIVPCSHVGHIFRKRSPYKWRTGVNVLKRNTVRLAEVWLDEYKKYYYERINWQLGDFGDISERVSLRKKLNCTSFKWFLDTIYPELFIPGEALASGEVRNQGHNRRKCLDSPVGKKHHHKAVSVYPCHDQGGNQIRNKGKGGTMCFDSPTGDEQNNKAIAPYPCHGAGGNQYWMLSKEGEIRRDESCVDYAGQDVMIFPCHGMRGNQDWRYDHEKHQLLHVVTNKCMEMASDGSRLQMTSCDPANVFQQWVFKNYNADKSKGTSTSPSAEKR